MEWLDYATVKNNYTTGGQDLMLWGKKHVGLLAVVPIATNYDARDWNLRHSMVITDTVTADDGNVYEIWESNQFRDAIRKEN